MGILERWHLTLKNSLKCYLDRDSWVQYLPFVLLGIRSAVDVETHISPAELLYGQHLRLPCQFFDLNHPGLEESDSIEQIRAVGEFLRSQEGIYPTYRANRDYLDPRLQNTRFVYVRRGPKKNLLPSYIGPFYVIDKYPKSFRLMISKTKTDLVSIDRLKACTAFPFNTSPIDVDLLLPGQPLQPSPAEELGEDIQNQPEEQESDVLEENPGILRDFFETAEEEAKDPLDTGIRTRSGRTIRIPAHLRDYQL